MLIERLLIAAVFFIAGAVVVFGGGERWLSAVWVAAVVLGLWILIRIVTNRRKHR